MMNRPLGILILISSIKSYGSSQQVQQEEAYAKQDKVSHAHDLQNVIVLEVENLTKPKITL